MDAILDGLLVSPPYVALTIAYGLLYSMLGVMDLTIPARFTAAAYSAWSCSHLLGWYPAYDPVVLGAAIVGCVVASALCWSLIKPLTGNASLAVLVGSLGLSIVCQALFQLCFGSAPKVFRSYPVESGIEVLGTTATPLQIASLIYSVITIVLIIVLLRVGDWGRDIKAVAANPEVAQSKFAINTVRVHWTTVGLVSLVIAPTAVFYGAGHGVSPTTAADIGLLAFVATIVAGKERPIGAVVTVVLLVIIRSVGIRWELTTVIASVAFIGALSVLYFRSMAPSRTSVVSVILLLVGAGVSGGVSLLKNDGFVVSAGFQDIVPYSAILMILLISPRGVFSSKVLREI